MIFTKRLRWHRLQFQSGTSKVCITLQYKKTYTQKTLLFLVEMKRRHHYAYLQTIILISYNLILNDRSVPRVKGRGLWSVLVSVCRVVLSKRCSENMQQIYRRIPMLKCNFNKVALHFNLLAITLQHRQSSINLLHIFRTTFLKNNA